MPYKVDLEPIPLVDTLGNGLRRRGRHAHGNAALTQVNPMVLQSTRHPRKAITQDIDATEVAASKADARDVPEQPWA